MNESEPEYIGGLRMQIQLTREYIETLLKETPIDYKAIKHQEKQIVVLQKYVNKFINEILDNNGKT